MKHSISRQFSMIFISILAGSFLLCMLANVLFLKDFYVANRKNEFEDAYEIINEYMQNNDLTDTDFINKMNVYCERHNLSLAIMDATSNPLVSFRYDSSTLKMQLTGYFVNDYIRNQSLGENQYILLMNRDVQTGISYMEMYGTLNNGLYFLMRSPMESLENNVLLANRFMINVAIFSMVVGVVVIVYMTRRITNPIRQLVGISSKMSGLDFSEKYQAKGNTEVDILGQQINKMSDKLESTISELKTANTELVRDIERKDKNDEIRKEFLSNISHELKTPIALIQGYAEGLKDCINDDVQSRDFYCDVIIDEANKMNNMVKNLLNLNELEAGKNMAKMEHFNVTELVKNILSSMDILFEQEEIRVECDLEEDLYVWADEFQVEEVFRNYITNAIHHAEGEKLIRIGFTRLENRLRVTVFNTGKPIPEESIPLLWDKFYKVDKARTRDYGGSGVGLSIVKAIMEGMDCKYGVHNHETGVSFYFELPV